MVSPVKVGEEYDVTIETVGSKGDGVAKIKGYVVFVKNVREGDQIKIRITKALDKVGFGEIVEKTGTANEKRDEKEIDASKLQFPKFSEEKEEADDKEDVKERAHEESDIIPEEEGAEVPDPEALSSEDETEKTAAGTTEEVPEADEDEE